MAESAPKWLEYERKLIRNNFQCIIEYHFMRDCTACHIKKWVNCDTESANIDDRLRNTALAGGYAIAGTYFFDEADSYEKFPEWVKELITAHRVIGVEEVVN